MEKENYTTIKINRDDVKFLRRIKEEKELKSITVVVSRLIRFIEDNNIKENI